jgi:hypothetical protein
VETPVFLLNPLDPVSLELSCCGGEKLPIVAEGEEWNSLKPAPSYRSSMSAMKPTSSGASALVA